MEISSTRSILSSSFPEAVVHIDRVCVSDTMPAVRAAEVDLVSATGEITPLLSDGRYVFDETA
ncbi:MAG: hypothetical protein KAI47_06470 [Deltaproteobacteria bacterium]|nr:hypothetical protein [Deltaproteobacteria bacterium]